MKSFLDQANREAASRPMSLSAIAIRRHIGTLMLTLAMMVVGLFALPQLPVDLLPAITYPRVGVRVATPGISPTVAIDEVTRPLEQALAATEGVELISSRTREGRVAIDLFFQAGQDVNRTLNDAITVVGRNRDRLPDTVEEPRVFKFDPSQLPVYELALTSASLTSDQLRVFGDEELVRELSIIPGVAGVDISGGVREEVRVIPDLSRIQALRLGLDDVLSGLRDRNQNVAGGRLRGADANVLTRTVGRFQSVDEIQSVDVAIPNTTPPQTVKLKDVATIIDGTEEQRVLVHLNGQPAVKLSIQKQPDANTVQVIKRVKERLDWLRRQGVFPDDLLLTATLDESQFIRHAIRNVAIAGLSGALLAGLAVLLFLGSLRQTLIVVLAIPLATLVAIILIGVFGLSLNVLTLGGLALGVGIVVDNAIVMLETIATPVSPTPLTPGSTLQALRSLASSSLSPSSISSPPKSPLLLSEAIQRSQSVESALVASTSTNLAAVLPFLFIGGLVALVFNELVLTISGAIAASLLIALTVVPALTAHLLARPGSSGISRTPIIRWFQRRIVNLTYRYQRVLERVLTRKGWAIALTILLLGTSSVWMANQLPQEILPQISTGQARLFARFPPGTALEDNQTVMAAVDEMLMAEPEVEYVFTTSGGFLFGTVTSENSLRGSSQITLQSGTDVAAFTERVQPTFDRLNLVNTSIFTSPGQVRGLSLNNSPVRSDIDVMLQGTEVDQLEQASAQVLEVLEQAALARYRSDADALQPELQIRPDWARMASLTLSTPDVGDTIQTALNGTVATQLQRGDRLVDVRVQLDADRLNRPEQISQLPLFTLDSQLIRVGDVATVIQGQAPSEIQRINQRQVYILQGSLNDGVGLGDALEELDRLMATVELPAGVSLLPSVSAANYRATQRAMLSLGGLATFLVFVVMAVQYNSLIDPLVIILTVPLALAGGILGLYVTQTPVGATVIVGAVLLVGIVVNNAIIMVELANQLGDRHTLDPTTAILAAAPQRLRPILMTTITTVLGLFPLALGLGEGSELLQPLGIVVFWGLSLATLLTLFIIPCFYSLLHTAQGTPQDAALQEGPR